MDKKNKILVTGGTGMLGKSLKSFIKNAYFLNGKKEIDLTNFRLVERFLKNNFYDIIVHSAAYTNIDFCQKNIDLSYKLHGELVTILQKYCDKLIFISTNKINSNKIYYKSKYLGESLTLKRNSDLVIRTNIVGDGGITLWAINSLKKNKIIYGFKDVFFNPIHTSQLSKFISIESKKFSGLVTLVQIEKKINLILSSKLLNFSI